jgi:hypothetical protein
MRVCNVLFVRSFSSLITFEMALKVGTEASTGFLSEKKRHGGVDRRGRALTCQLKDGRFAGGDETSFLTDAAQGERGFLWVATRHAICQDVDDVPSLDEIYRGLQDAYV